MLGSCFADNIGAIMGSVGFHTLVNPLGTTYNPLSLADSLARIDSAVPFSPSECVTIGAGDGRFCSFLHHTRHARPTADEFLADANANLAAAHAFWSEAQTLIVTLGTAWCFRRVDSGQVVSNCLKRLPSEFTRFRLTLDECVAALERIVELAAHRNVIFTVSPIRHLADGAHGNQLSKSTLLLAADVVTSRHSSSVAYFPSYEIILDELRDYRFYSDDMTHPSPLAEQYVFSRFMDFALPDSERPALQDGVKRAKAGGHRSMGY